MLPKNCLKIQKTDRISLPDTLIDRLEQICPPKSSLAFRPYQNTLKFVSISGAARGLFAPNVPSPWIHRAVDSTCSHQEFLQNMPPHIGCGFISCWYLHPHWRTLLSSFRCSYCQELRPTASQRSTPADFLPDQHRNSRQKYFIFRSSSGPVGILSPRETGVGSK